MKISHEWLKDYIEIDKSPEQLAKDLSLFGHEAESIEKIGDDFMLDLEITPNRGDCLSILGIAREIAALYNLKVQISNLKINETVIDQKVTVKIFDPKICPRFTARIIDNIKIGESPKWIEERLASYGFRPINNIVDITNFVMVATGQPLHAFDWDKINNGLMNIRQAKNGEEIMTLDGQNRVLNEGAIIIEDDKNIYDLAGIMGGIKSEVDEKTKTIILQGAIFDPILIRKTSKYLNHITDASYRYERGVDFEGTIAGVDMAASLIKEVCSDAKIGELVDMEIRRQEDRKIRIEIEKINKLLGTNISQEDTEGYLQRLGFKINDNIVTVPSYRAYDVKIWQDLAEEIARVYGYNKIAKCKMQNAKLQFKIQNEEFQKREYIKDMLKEIGFTEIYSYSFAKRDKIELLGSKIDECVEVANPLSPETQYLRPSLLPSLLAAIAKNPWAPEVNIFEIGKVFTSNEERWQLGIASTGKNNNAAKEALKKLNITAEIGSVEQKILDKYKIRRPVNYVLFSLDDVSVASNKYSLDISKNKYYPISRYAPTVRDLAFVVKEDIEADKITETIKSQDDKILLVELFDEFLFKNGTKNLAFHIWLEDQDKPMAEDEVEEILKNIISVVADKFGGKLRSEEFKEFE